MIPKKSKRSKTQPFVQSVPKKEYVGSPQYDDSEDPIKVAECETLGGAPHSPQDRGAIDCDARVASHSNSHAPKPPSNVATSSQLALGLELLVLITSSIATIIVAPWTMPTKATTPFIIWKCPHSRGPSCFWKRPAPISIWPKFRWLDPAQCPTAQHSVPECEIDQKCETPRVAISTVGSPESHLLVVDGVEEDDGVYRLSVECMPVL